MGSQEKSGNFNMKFLWEPCQVTHGRPGIYLSPCDQCVSVYLQPAGRKVQRVSGTHQGGAKTGGAGSGQPHRADGRTLQSHVRDLRRGNDKALIIHLFIYLTNQVTSEIFLLLA